MHILHHTDLFVGAVRLHVCLLQALCVAINCQASDLGCRMVLTIL